MVSTHIVGFTLIATQWIHFFLLLSHERKSSSYIKWVLCQLILGVLYLPIFLKIINRFDLKKEIPIIYAWVPKPDLSDLFGSFLYLSGHGVLFIVFLAIAGFALKYMKNIKSDEVTVDSSIQSYLLLWLLMPMLALFIYSQIHHPIFIARGFVISMTPLILLSSFYYLKYSQSKFHVVTVGFAVVLSVQQSIGELTSKVENWREMSNIISTNDSKAPILINPGYAALPLSYYLKPSCFFDKNFKDCIHENAIIVVNNKSDFLKDKRNIWFVGYNVDNANNESYFENFKVHPKKLHPSIYYQYIEN
jgi:hypothetical protein